MEAITLVNLQISLKKEGKAKTFTFWCVPRIILHLAFGLLDFEGITYLVREDELECEDLLIGIQFLTHLKIETKIPLETNCENSYDFEYSVAEVDSVIDCFAGSKEGVVCETSCAARLPISSGISVWLHLSLVPTIYIPSH